jgi:hypothetical protein
MDNISNGNIVANFKRNGSGWSFKALGYYTKDTRRSSEMIPIIEQVMQNDFRNIKILTPENSRP